MSKPRAGSLQFWPRKRARKLLPSVNWTAISKKNSGLLGLICYKAGMARALVRDLTPASMTKGKEIVLPITFVECPGMAIASVRFYSKGQVASEIFVGKTKELKRKLKLPRQPKDVSSIKAELEKVEGFDDVRLLVYSLTRKKKTPDLAEIGFAGSLQEKLSWIKDNLDKEIKVKDVESKLFDVHGVTKGKGLVGPVKRFGIGLRQKKSEKGQRRPGSLGPWTPARVTFRAPLAGQLGFFSRVQYNVNLIQCGKAQELDFEFPRYGKITTEWLALKGSIPGPAKRPLLLTKALRPTKQRAKASYDFIRWLK